MTHRLLMICALRPKRPLFPARDDKDAIDDVAPLLPPAPRADRAWRGPDALARKTAAALGLDATITPELAEIDFGSWRGRTLEDVAGSDPDGFRSWIADPSTAPHGGESIEALLRRVGGWLADCGGSSGRSIAVAPASVVKACLLDVLAAPATSFARIDLEPLSRTAFVHDGRRWALRLPGPSKAPVSDDGL